MRRRSQPPEAPPRTESTPIRCAIYTRKSTEEGLDQEFNSLQAQREAAEAYIQSQKHLGWVLVKTSYDDGGFSGGSLERPALRQLLEDIEARRVDCVVVYKVDRLSRSLLDFARLIDRFDQRTVSFVSVTQQFNTTSSLGRLTLNILFSFAQFEREIIGERTRDKMAAARRKGKWIGGAPPLGYDVHPAGGRLVVNQEEAHVVKEIFALYKTHPSVSAVVAELRRRQWKSKTWVSKSGGRHGDRLFRKRSLRHLLTHAVYAGKVEYQGRMYEGEHPAIVDLALWEEVNARLGANHHQERADYTKQNALLAGRLFCKSCSTPMRATYSMKHGQRYRYYLCATAKTQGWGACATKNVPSQVLEDSVVEHLSAALGAEETRTEWSVIEREWQRFREGETAGLVGALVERMDYEGSTGTVRLDLRPQGEGTKTGGTRIEYRIPVRRPSAPFTLAPPGQPLGQPPRVARLLALSHKLEGLVQSRTVKDYALLARLGHISTSRLSQILGLTHLAPAIQERILFLPSWEDGRITERELRAIASEIVWEKQCVLFEASLGQSQIRDPSPSRT